MSDTNFTNGTPIVPAWLNDVNDLVYGFPNQSGNDGKYLKTNAGALSWDTPSGGGGTSLDGYIVMSVDNGYIVDPTGATDCTSEVQRFFDDCASSKGFMPPGKYKITNTITIDPNKTYFVEGAGYNIYGGPPSTWPGGTTIYNANTGNQSAFDIINNNYANTDDQLIVFKDFTILGNQNSGNGIYMKNIHGFRGERLWISTNGHSGVILYDCWGVSFKECVATQNGEYGVELDNRCNHVVFDHCTFNTNSRSDGFANVIVKASNGSGYESAAISFLGCDFSYAGSNPWPAGSVTTAYGLVTQRSYNPVVQGCYFEGNKTYGFYSDNTTKGLNLTGNHFVDTVVLVDNTQNFNIAYNTFWQANTTCTFNVVGSSTSVRESENIVGNSYIGSVTKNFTGNTRERVEIFGTGVPSSGTWETSDIVWVRSPASGQIIAYQCIAGGTPGTWIAMIDGKDTDGNLILRKSDGTNPITIGTGKGGTTSNTVLGYQAGNAFTTANQSVAVGYNALSVCTTGYNNVAVGRNALLACTTAIQNVAVGNRAADTLTTGDNNFALGHAALSGLTTGTQNVAVGTAALLGNNGSANMALGYNALRFKVDGSTQYTGDNSIGIGASAYCDAGNSLAIGYNALANGTNTIAIGYGSGSASGTANNTIYMGNSSISSAKVQVAWTVTSDRKYKENISSYTNGLDIISKLKPVEYTRIGDDKKEIGFIAQDVAESIDSSYGLVSVDNEGTYGLRKDDLIAVLTSAVQELNEKIKLLESKNDPSNPN